MNSRKAKAIRTMAKQAFDKNPNRPLKYYIKSIKKILKETNS